MNRSAVYLKSADGVQRMLPHEAFQIMEMHDMGSGLPDAVCARTVESVRCDVYVTTPPDALQRWFDCVDCGQNDWD